MNHPDVIKVLLVEDDEDDFILTRGLFRQIKGREFVLDWAKSFAEGLHWMCRNTHDICLVDYRLGADDGVGLLKAAIAGGCQSPVILLTGMGQREVDMAAMNAGATDYLVKAEVDASELERTIRYALERKRAAVAAAFEQARLAAFGSTVGLALTRDNPLNAILQECAEAMVQFQGAALAQIWAYDTERQTPEPRVSAGPICVAGIAPVDFPTAPPAVEELMRGGAVIVKSLLDDPRVADGERLAQSGLASFAGYPLMLENRLIGLIGIYTGHPLTDAVTQEFASVAHGIALFVVGDNLRKGAALNAVQIAEVLMGRSIT